MIYRTINDEVFDLDDLSESHRDLYEEMKGRFLSGIKWCEFDNICLSDIRIRNPKVSTDSPIWKILRDMSGRIMVRDNWARLSDWREGLEHFIQEIFESRRDFCQKTGIDEGHLSNVLTRKRKNRKAFSLDFLEKALAKAGIRIVFMPVDLSKTGEEE